MHGPQERLQLRSRRLHEHGQIDRERAEAHAQAAQRGPLFLADALELARHFQAWCRSEVFVKLVCKATRHALQRRSEQHLTSCRRRRGRSRSIGLQRIHDIVMGRCLVFLAVAFALGRICASRFRRSGLWRRRCSGFLDDRHFFVQFRLQRHKRRKRLCNMMGKPFLESLRRAFTRGRTEKIVSKQFNARMERFVSLAQASDDAAVPPHAPMLRQRDGRVGCVRQRLCPRGNLARQSLQRGRADGFPVNADCPRVRNKGKALQLADILAFDQHFAIILDGGCKLFILAQTAHKDACATVDKALRQLFVKRI